MCAHGNRIVSLHETAPAVSGKILNGHGMAPLGSSNAHTGDRARRFLYAPPVIRALSAACSFRRERHLISLQKQERPSFKGFAPLPASRRRPALEKGEEVWIRKDTAAQKAAPPFACPLPEKKRGTCGVKRLPLKAIFEAESSNETIAHTPCRTPGSLPLFPGSYAHSLLEY